MILTDIRFCWRKPNSRVFTSSTDWIMAAVGEDAFEHFAQIVRPGGQADAARAKMTGGCNNALRLLDKEIGHVKSASQSVTGSHHHGKPECGAGQPSYWGHIVLNSVEKLAPTALLFFAVSTQSPR
jgi:hypothetical protein